MINLKPAVPKNILILISALMWSLVGILLNSIAYRWFSVITQKQIILAIIIGIILGLAITIFGFSKIVKKNIKRINNLPKKPCIFAFQSWQNYLLIIFMISLGIFLRNTSFFPKIILTSMYIGIGFALFSSSFIYYYDLIIKIKKYKT